MGLLGVARPRLVAAGLGEGVGLPVLALHELGDLAERRVGDRDRVGPHIGDEPDRSLAREVDPLVEPLGQGHRAAGGEAELSGGLLLERRGRERGRRRALPLLLLDPRDPVAGAAEQLDVASRLGLRAEHYPLLVGARRELALRDLGEPRDERLLRALRREPDAHAPVLDRNEGLDLALPLDDQPDGDRLDPARRESRLDPAPQDRGDPVADQPVKDPAGLLGVEELQVDRAGMGESIQDRVAGDLGEGHALGIRRLEAEQGGHVEGDRLSLAVEVGGKNEVLGALQRLLEVRDMLLRVVGDHVVHGEIVVQVDPELGFREVPDVAIGGPDGVLAAQVLLDRLGLGR